MIKNHSLGYGSRLINQLESNSKWISFSSSSQKCRCPSPILDQYLNYQQLSTLKLNPSHSSMPIQLVRLFSTSSSYPTFAALQNQKPKTNTLKFIETPATTTNPAPRLKSPSPTTSPISLAFEQAKKTVEKYKIKELFKKYGLPFVVYYSSLYVGCGVGIYFLLDSGIWIGGQDVVNWIGQTPLRNYFDLTQIDPLYCNIGGAVVANELFEIVRLPFALLTIPYVKNAWDSRKGKKKEDKE